MHAIQLDMISSSKEEQYDRIQRLARVQRWREERDVREQSRADSEHRRKKKLERVQFFGAFNPVIKTNARVRV